MSYFKNKIKAIYDYALSEVIKGQDEWRKVPYLAGQLYRFEFATILMIYAQRPDATLVADYDTWKKVDRSILETHQNERQKITSNQYSSVQKERQEQKEKAETEIRTQKWK